MKIYAENGSNYIKALDTLSIVKLQVLNDDGTVVKLSTFDNVVVKIGNINGTIVTINPLSLTDEGLIEFKIPAYQLPNGVYILEIHLTKGNEVKIAPSDTTAQFTVKKSLDELGNVINTMSVNQLVSSVNQIRTDVTAFGARMYDTGWITTNYSNGFTKVSSEPCRYKKSNYVIHIQMTFKGDKYGESYPIFTLPSNIKPDATLQVPITMKSKDGSVRGLIKNTGDIVLLSNIDTSETYVLNVAYPL